MSDEDEMPPGLTSVPVNHNPSFDMLLQLLDVGDVLITREDLDVDNFPGLDRPQSLTVELRRRTDGATYSSRAILSGDDKPVVFGSTLALIFAQGVDKIRRG